MKSKNNLIIYQINNLKSEMIKLGLTKGFSNPDTVKCSQKLDELIVLYQKENK